VDVPLIALGGVADVELARQCLAAGAQALLIDGALYGDPAAAQRIGAALQRNASSEAASA
jgi:dihydroorotate dehydrogenase